MAALNFPPSPSTNQIYTANGKSWRFDGTSWKTYYILNVQGGGTGNSFYNLGDILVGAGTSLYPLPVGSNNFVLTADNSAAFGVTWRSTAATGITTLNSLTATTQYFSIGYSGNFPSVSSSGSTHTFNIPIAGIGATGLVSTLAQSFAGIKTFTNDLIVSSSTVSTSTSTGALTISGGVGIGGSLFLTTSVPSSLSGIVVNNGVITAGSWAGSTITAYYGGTGYNSYNKGDILVGAGNTFIKLNVGTDSYVLTASSSTATGLTWSPTAATGLTTLNGLNVGIQYFAFGYSGSIPVFSSSGSTHTLNIPLAGTGSTGLISTQAQTIAGQKTFTSAIIGDLTGTATTAGFASTANYAYQSGYGITSGFATTASYSYQSGYGITSGFATTANYAYQSGYGITAGLATTASYAYQSGYGITAGFATTASYSYQAGYGITAGFATTASYSYQSGYGITAGFATTASYSYQSGYGITSGFATTATYAYQSGYAITSGSSNTSGYATTSGLATTAANLNVANALSGTFYPVLSNTSSSASGIAASVNNFFSFNAATGSFGATSINILSGQSYSVGGNSVLSATSLGTGVTNSSLTALGTITSGSWAGSLITGYYGGTGYNSYTKGDILVGAGNTFIKLNVGTDNYVLTADTASPGGVKWTNVSGISITSINGVNASYQYFATGTSGSGFNIVSSGSTHTFNIPIAGTGATGLVSTLAQSFAGIKTFTNDVIISSTTGSTAYNTGALTVYGGLGVSGQLSFNQAALGYTGASNPSIAFIGSTTAAPITLTVLSDNSLIWEGTSGKLFGINNNLSSGWIFNVGDISGLPIIRANADGTIAMAEFTANVGIGLSNPSYKLHVVGDTNLSSGYVYRINGTQVLSSTSLGTGVTNSSLTAVGTLSTGVWAATAITAFYGGTGYNSYTKGDILVGAGSTFIKLGVGTDSYVLTANSASATGLTWSPTAATGLTTLNGLNVGIQYFAIGYTGAVPAFSSSGSTHTLNIPIAGSGATGLISTQAQTIAGQKTFTSPIIGDLTGTATTAGFATTASYSYQAGYAITSGFATTSSYSYQSGYATTSGLATTATLALTISSTSTNANTDYNIPFLSGTALSTNSNLYYNPSTGRLNATLHTGSWAGNTITSYYGGTGFQTYSTGDLLVGAGSTLTKITVGSNNFILVADSTVPGGIKWASAAGIAITNLNGLTASKQDLAFGYSGTVPAFSSSGSTHTLNIPLAGTGSTGLVSTQAQSFAGIKTFTNAVSITDNTGSGSYTAGALVVTGGVGIGGTLNVQGDLNIQGTFTTINSTTITVADKNIELGVVSSPTDLTAQGGGITLRGATDKSINWYSGVGWSSSESWNLASGNTYKINGTTVLSSNTLGTGVIFSSIQTAGIITSGTWSATAITALYGGTGLVPSFAVGDILYANTSSTWGRLAANSNAGYVLTSAGSGATPTYVAPSTLSVGFASTASYSYQSGYGATSGFATTASYSYQAGYGITAGLATTATYSYQSGYGITAGFATTASYAYQSGYGITAGFATTASYSYQSGYGITSGFATTANYAYQSGYGITAGFATTASYSYQSGYGITAGFATTASYSYQSGYGITSGFATTASYSYQSGYGITSGFATTSSNINVANAASGTFFPVLSSTSSSASGIGASVNGFFSFNAATGAFGATSVNIISGQSYSIGGNSVLSATSLGTGVTNSYLTALGTITTGVWSATAITAYYGGTGYNSYAIGDLLVGAGSTLYKLPVGTNAYVLTADSTAPGGVKWSVAASTGVTTINSLTASIQYFSTGTSGSGFNIASSGSTHTFNIPIAGTGSTGLVSTLAQSFAGIKTFTNDIVISSNTVSTSTSTGALTVTGGVGIGGSLFTGTSTADSISGVVLNNGVITTGAWAGSTITAYYGGTGYNSYTKGDVLVGAGNTFIKFGVGTNNYVLGANSASGSGLTWRTASSATATTSTAPSNPLSGDFWYDTTDGSLSVYYNDGDTSQWVEVAGAFTGNVYYGNSYNIPYYNANGIGITGSASFTNVGTGISILYTAPSTSTTSGALTVSGGVGIGGSLYTATTSADSISGVVLNNGVITSGSWSATAITAKYGGTGYTGYTLGDILVGAGSTFIQLPVGINGYVLGADSSRPSGVGWTSVSALTVSATAPSSPKNADLWFNSYDGSLLVYYQDIDTSQWVEIALGSGVDLTQPVHITNNTASTSTSTGALIVDGGVGVLGALHTSSLVINGTYDVVGTSITLTGTGAGQVIYTLDASIYRSVKFMVQVTHGTDYQVQEILLLHDSVDTYLTQYAQLLSGNNLVLTTYDADLDSGNMRLLVSPSYTNTTFKIYGTAVRV